MVVLNRIYTRTGDAGTTALGTGERRLKCDLRIEAYGTIDETNAAIGMARQHIGRPAPDGDPVVDAMLQRMQNDLFDLGADLCTPPSGDDTSGANTSALRIVEAQVERVEREIDQLNADLQPLRSFVLPGGSPAAAALHLARTICRRAERLMVALARQPDERVGEPALKYVNRLSDFLFVASRHVNDGGTGDILWVKGLTRDL